MANDYQTFLQSKRLVVPATGRVVADGDIHPILFPFQRDIVRWALRKGRAAIFADTGLGKTFMQLEWARHMGTRVLILAPLSVARQTVGEASRIGLSVHYTRRGSDLVPGVNITNYEMADHFNASDFGAVVLDESSILKSLDSLTRLRLTEQFRGVPHKLCCTATPAPNDLKEIVNHADFLGVMTRREVFATFFINEDKPGGGLYVRLKRHAVKPFYQWMASWAMAIKRPSDLGYDDTGYVLPGLTLHPHVVPTDYRPDDMLFFVSLEGVQDRARVQRATLEERIRRAAVLVNADAEQWIVWHHLNDEGYALAAAIRGGVLVEGRDSAEAKAEAFEKFIDGTHRVLITKASIAGFGLNFQNASKMCFASINDSFEEFYQAIRRSYRFGQRRPVEVHVVYADVQQQVYENIQRKEREAAALTDNLVQGMQSYERDELANTQRGEDYRTGEARGESWRLLLGDSAECLKGVTSDSVALGVHSPPFIARYTYTPTERDLGNSRDLEQFMEHYRFIIRELYRVTMPGRNQCVHCQQVRLTKRDTGNVSLVDFRGAIIRAFEAEGFVYYADFTVDKDAQQQARRKHHVGLKFQTLHTDSSKLGSALADYLLVFKKLGDNAVPVMTDVTEEEWISWARPVWYDINEIDVLDTQKAKADDEMHLCPLQLPFIERCIRLWSNPGETVISPFAGVGSELYMAVKLGRQAIGVELKPEYFETAVKNLRQVEAACQRQDLFTWAAEQQGVEAQA